MSAESSGLSEWLGAVGYYLQRRGIAYEDRTRLIADLERDLGLALAEGASVEELTLADPNDFAGELVAAEGLGVVPLRPDHALTTGSLVLTALLGAAAGAGAAAVLVYPLGLRLLDQLALSYTAEGFYILGLHAIAAVLCTASAIVAIRWRFRFHERIWRTATVTGLFLLLGGAVSVVPTMVLAASLRYSSQAGVVVLELGVVVAFCVLGVGTARWLLTRASASRPTSA